MDLEPAYLAGVLDSDGSLSITIRQKSKGKPFYRAIFQLTWTATEKSIEVIKNIQTRYGGSFFIPSLSSKSFRNSKQTIKYSLEGIGLYDLLVNIKPFVKLKNRQVETLMKLIDITPLPGHRKSDDILNQQHQLYLLNKSFNTKNSGNRRIHVQT